MHCIETLKTAFPKNVAPKKTPKGTKNYPHMSPAKSKRGLGIEANNVTTINA